MEIISYYVSKEHAKVRFARLIATNPQDVYLNEPLEKMPEMMVLENAPFKSRFIGEGDELFDVSSSFDSLISRKDLGFAAVLNASTGRLVVRGNGVHHLLVKPLMIRRGAPVQIESCFDLYLLPPEKNPLSLVDLKDLPSGAKKLKSLTLRSLPRQRVKAKDPSGELEVEVDLSANSEDSFLTGFGTIGLRTVIDGEKVVVRSGLPFFSVSGVARLVDLGSFGTKGHRLCIVQKMGIFHRDGTSIDEFILKEVPGPPFHYSASRPGSRNESLFFESEEEIPIGVWRVHRTLVPFLSSATDGKESDITNGKLKEPGGYWDIRNLFEAQGVKFEVGDYAKVFPNRGLLLVQASPSQLELVDAICLGTGPRIPRDIKVFFGEVESEVEPEINLLGSPKVSMRAHGAVPLPLGQYQYYFCKSAGQRVKFEVEAQTAATNKVVHLCLKGLIRAGQEKPKKFEESLTLKSGEPEIISKTKVSGKWRAFVVRAEICEATDQLPE